jgi:hypothetical protein
MSRYLSNPFLSTAKKLCLEEYLSANFEGCSLQAPLTPTLGPCMLEIQPLKLCYLFMEALNYWIPRFDGSWNDKHESFIINRGLNIYTWVSVAKGLFFPSRPAKTVAVAAQWITDIIISPLLFSNIATRITQYTKHVS